MDTFANHNNHNVTATTTPTNLSIDSNNNISTYHQIPHESFFLFLNHMTVYVLPLEIFIGCVGNLLACYVFCSSHLIQQSCNVYLTFLALVDTVFLMCTLFVWLDFLDIGYSVFSLNGFCQGLPYLTYVFSFLSGYIVLSFTVERFIVTFYPLQRQHMCTTKRAKLVVGGLTVFGVIFYSFPLYMSTVVKYEGYQECRPLAKFNMSATILASIDSILTLMLPSVIIVVLNMAIAIKISHILSAKSRKRLGQYGGLELQYRGRGATSGVYTKAAVTDLTDVVMNTKENGGRKSTMERKNNGVLPQPDRSVRHGESLAEQEDPSRKNVHNLLDVITIDAARRQERDNYIRRTERVGSDIRTFGKGTRDSRRTYSVLRTDSNISGQSSDHSTQLLVKQMSSVSCNSSGEAARSSGRSHGARSQVRTTRTLIVLSSLFVFLKLPSHALRLHTFIHSFLSSPPLSHSDTMWLVAWQELCQFVYYLNFAGNFFLYCLVSQVFRQVAATKLKIKWTQCLKRCTRRGRSSV